VHFGLIFLEHPRLAGVHTSRSESSCFISDCLLPVSSRSKMDDYSGHGRHRALETMLTCHVDMSQTNMPYPFQADMGIDMDLGMAEPVCSSISKCITAG
jgi:hypothetical protein